MALKLPTWAFVAVTLVALTLPAIAEATGFCQVRFQFNAGPMPQLQRYEVNMRLEHGESRTVDQARMDYIVNLGPNSLRVWLTGGPRSEVLLGAGERDPAARLGYFFGPRPIRLDRLDCLPARADAATSLESSWTSERA